MRAHSPRGAWCPHCGAIPRALSVGPDQSPTPFLPRAPPSALQGLSAAAVPVQQMRKPRLGGAERHGPALREQLRSQPHPLLPAGRAVGKCPPVCAPLTAPPGQAGRHFMPGTPVLPHKEPAAERGVRGAREGRNSHRTRHHGWVAAGPPGTQGPRVGNAQWDALKTPALLQPPRPFTQPTEGKTDHQGGGGQPARGGRWEAGHFQEGSFWGVPGREAGPRPGEVTGRGGRAASGALPSEGNAEGLRASRAEGGTGARDTGRPAQGRGQTRRNRPRAERGRTQAGPLLAA